MSLLYVSSIKRVKQIHLRVMTFYHVRKGIGRRSERQGQAERIRGLDAKPAGPKLGCYHGKRVRLYNGCLRRPAARRGRTEGSAALYATTVVANHVFIRFPLFRRWR